MDVDDCCFAARHLAEQGLADPARLCITGGSAGGYTTLAALSFRWAGQAAGGRHLRQCTELRAGCGTAGLAALDKPLLPPPPSTDRSQGRVQRGRLSLRCGRPGAAGKGWLAKRGSWLAGWLAFAGARFVAPLNPAAAVCTHCAKQDTHKFESRYLDGLIGPYPEVRVWLRLRDPAGLPHTAAARHTGARRCSSPPASPSTRCSQAKATYTERSPLHALDGFTSPVAFFQGLQDEIVPPNQASAGPAQPGPTAAPAAAPCRSTAGMRAQMAARLPAPLAAGHFALLQAQVMFEALKQQGIPTALVLFEGEQHGFRQAPNIRRVARMESPSGGQAGQPGQGCAAPPSPTSRPPRHTAPARPQARPGRRAPLLLCGPGLQRRAAARL